MPASVYLLQTFQQNLSPSVNRTDGLCFDRRDGPPMLSEQVEWGERREADVLVNDWTLLLAGERILICGYWRT